MYTYYIIYFHRRPCQVSLSFFLARASSLSVSAYSLDYSRGWYATKREQSYSSYSLSQIRNYPPLPPVYTRTHKSIHVFFRTSTVFFRIPTHIYETTLSHTHT